MKGKRGLVMGVANERSLAWGIARKLGEAGADLAFSHQGKATGKRVRPLAAQRGSDFLIDCDVAHMADLDAAFVTLAARWKTIDFVVHAIGSSDRNELRGRFRDTTADNFIATMNVSVYSFIAVARLAKALMPSFDPETGLGGGSLLTLSCVGAERVIPNYNIMGVAKAALEASVRYLAVDLGRDNIRVNAISSGPIKTLAASGIDDFRSMLRWNELNAPLGRNVTIDDVGGTGLYLCSDLSSGVTGEMLHVDAGYNIVGMKAQEATGDA